MCRKGEVVILMSRTYRKARTIALNKVNTQRPVKKNKSSWRVFREENHSLHTLKYLTKHTKKVHA